METIHIDLSKTLSEREQQVLNRLVRQEMEERGEKLLLAKSLYTVVEIDASISVTLSHAILKRSAKSAKAGRAAANRYQILGQSIGKGAYGQVFDSPAFRITDRSIQMSQKNRVVKLQCNTRMNTIDESGSWCQGIKKELQYAAAVYRTRIKEPVFTCLANGEGIQAYQCMERFSGKGLDSLLEEKALPTEWAKKKDLCSQLAKKMQEVHDAGLVHRDIKPANIVYDANTNTASIVDFGSAKGEYERVFELPACVGTLPYRAPELCLNKHTTPESDVFSLSAVMGEVLGASADQIFFEKNKRLDGPFPSRAYYEATYNFSDIQVPLRYQSSVKSMLASMANPDPSERPTLNDVSRFFDQLPVEISRKRKQRFFFSSKPRFVPSRDLCCEDVLAAGGLRGAGQVGDALQRKF